jgi:hypothetical protein
MMSSVLAFSGSDIGNEGDDSEMEIKKNKEEERRLSLF